MLLFSRIVLNDFSKASEFRVHDKRRHKRYIAFMKRLRKKHGTVEKPFTLSPRFAEFLKDFV